MIILYANYEFDIYDNIDKVLQISFYLVKGGGILL